jgi:hypothetical protein
VQAVGNHRVGAPRLSTAASRASLAVLALILAATSVACGDQGTSGNQADTDPAEFSTTIDNPLLPLSVVRATVFEGSEPDPDTGEAIETRSERRLIDETFVVDGTRVAILEVKEYEDGELVESTRDYFAQREDGSVWYFGEHVDDLEEGKVIGHEGAWLAGEDGAQAGLFMPADPEVGQVFEQEQAPGVAEDRSTVVAIDISAAVPAGTFDKCIKTRDFAPLDKVTEFKFYCEGVGLVSEEKPGGGGGIELVTY